MNQPSLLIISAPHMGWLCHSKWEFTPCKFCSLLSVALAGLIFVSCAGGGGGIGVISLASGDSAYVKNKIEKALGKNDIVKSVQCVSMPQNERVLLITLSDYTPEKICLDAMYAISRDPSIPQVDSVMIVTCSSGHAIGLKTGVGGIYQFQPTSIEEGAPLFKCGLLRNSLLKGEKPIVYMRNGSFV